jgi:hypothetical protein
MSQRDSPWEVVIMVASAATLITCSSLVVRFDERRLGRLDEERLERAWPEAGRDNALIGMGMLLSPLVPVLAVWLHFFRTRSTALWPPRKWSVRGWLLGLACAVALMAVNVGVVLTIAAAAGLDVE